MHVGAVGGVERPRLERHGLQEPGKENECTFLKSKFTIFIQTPKYGQYLWYSCIDSLL
eukprot:SAG31_NODE_4506_length_3179_cov_1.712338_4_plen_58_part_00